MILDPARFRAPYIPAETAWAEADRVRAEFWPSGEIPVEVEEILWAVGLRVEPIQSLREAGDVDALLRGDLTSVVVDADEYMDDRMLNRIRFSMAHELGHFVLHAELYRGMAHASIEQWIDFIHRVPEDQWGFVELHAYEFAGRLLVPSDRLRKEITAAAKVAEDAGFIKWDQTGDAAREYMSNSIARTFGVSSQVIEKRIIREKLWPPT
jgi:hypothetical protein